MMLEIVTILLILSGSFSQELNEDNLMPDDENVRDREGQVVVQTSQEYLKGDPGAVRLTDTRMERVRRDGSQGQGQLPPTLSDTSPFVAPVQTSYFLGQCLMCPPGGPGPRGPPGQAGQSGRDGRDGRDQALYPLHTDGGSSSNSDKHDETVHTIANHTNTGVTYTRWGKTTCPPSSEIVYEGVMASGHYNEKGGGANYLCLSSDPIFDEPQAGEQHGARIYGAEYEFSSFPPMSSLYQEDVPCVVCLALSKHHVLMIPGRNQCPQQHDWILEYNGFIMADHHSQSRSEYICVDKTAEGIPRTGHNDNFALIRLAEVVCGSNGGGLPCPPYANGYELTCAVCTM